MDAEGFERCRKLELQIQQRERKYHNLRCELIRINALLSSPYANGSKSILEKAHEILATAIEELKT